MKIHGGKLTDRHWKIIKYLRDRFQKTQEVPTIYETCEANQITIEELEYLFPDGYHRGAVKLAGLRMSGPPSGYAKTVSNG
jgi:tRNA 2-thiouridine synthesizing protein E